MAWNGTGTFNRIHSWAADAINGLFISSSRMDAEFDGIAQGLQNCVTRNGENQPLANLPMGAFRHTGVGTASARDQYAQVGQIQDTSFVWGGSAGGTANALTIALTPAITALTAGQTVRFITGAGANTGAATLAVNGLTATAIVKEGGAALVAGDLPATSLIEVVHNGTNYRLARTSGTSLTDVVHLSGAETITGQKTFDNITRISYTAAELRLRDTAQTLPAGLFSLRSDANAFRFVRNTAAAGDFSTALTTFQVDASNNGIFTGTLTAAAATVSTELVTKAQLDAKVYGGQIANSGTASVTYGPSGWTVSRTGVGLTTVTHNLGTTSYAVALTRSSAGAARLVSIATNSFAVTTLTPAEAAQDADYHFVVSRN